MEDTLGMVLSVLESTPRRWIHLAETISPELLRRPAAPKEWSAHECLQHMVDTERMVFPRRIGYRWAGHDLMHTVQGERAIMQVFIDACGPWKKYFSDHVAG